MVEIERGVNRLYIPTTQFEEWAIDFLNRVIWILEFHSIVILWISIVVYVNRNYNVQVMKVHVWKKLRFACSSFWIHQKDYVLKGHFTEETESPWPFHVKHSRWWKRRSWSKFASHYARGTNGVSMWMKGGCKLYEDSHMAPNGSCFMVTWTFFQKTASWR